MYGLAAAIVVVTAQAAAFWLYLQQRRSIDRLEDRLSHLTAGISLLTDTTEGGLRDIARELERAAKAEPAPRPKPRAATQRRVAGAAKRGKSVQQIAAAEEMAEGEVRLRLQLADARRDQVHDAAAR